MTAPTPAIPRPSAATLLLRAGEDGLEVFMVRRPVQSEFVPDVYVFPGGSVHPEDCEAEVTPGVIVPFDALGPATALGTGMRVAAIRELFEEAGILLAIRDHAPIGRDPLALEHFPLYRDALDARTMTMAEIAVSEDCVLMTDALIHYAHWITPEYMPKRFSTHFFLAEAPAEQSAQRHTAETTDAVWINPAIALQRWEAGTFPLVFATIHQLRDLVPYTTPTAALAAWRGRVPPTIQPRVIQHEGKPLILMPDEADPA